MILLAAASLLFHAPLETTPAAAFATGDREPLNIAGVRFAAGSAQLPPNAKLTYDARGNLRADRGAAAFWWRPDEAPGRLAFALLQISYEQSSDWGFNFARVVWSGSGISASVRDRNLQYHPAAEFKMAPKPGEWVHIALAWSERAGVALYVNGKPAGTTPGPLALAARLDQFGFLTPHVSPHMTSGNQNRGSIRDARVYDAALGAADVARVMLGGEPVEAGAADPAQPALYGWTPAAGIPRASALYVKRIPVMDARDVRRFWYKVADGKRETVWPALAGGYGYSGEGRTCRIRTAAEPVNLVRTTGNLSGRIALPGGEAYARPAAGEVHYHRHVFQGGEVTVARESGVAGDVEFLYAEPARTVNGPFTKLPADTDTPLDAVQVRLRSEPEAFYSIAIDDPVNEARHLMEFEVQAVGDSLNLTCDFPDVIVAPGKRPNVRVASSHPLAEQPDIRFVRADATPARAVHLAQRMLQIRDSFQMLSEERPWMYLGARVSVPQLRRRLKLVDELYALLEDVRHVEPGHPQANAYWGWINRLEPPPPFDEPPAPAGVPLWAHRQLILLKQFREVVDWWIENRQVESGEFGGELGDDTDLIQNWPGVALLDGPKDRIAGSVRRVLEACYAAGKLERGLNARRTDALHAYEEGINAFGPAFLLDYGNPVLLERMMETAAHYPRLTGINAAGHRHFRSIRFSATDLVEEGYHAREDAYSHLILQPGLWLAWYNGLPVVRGLLEEYAGSLLAHWRAERYPQLAKGIFFADDRVEGRGSPNTETYNLFWGLYDVTRNPNYMWLLREAAGAGDFARAGATSGAWVDARMAGPLLEDVKRRKIHDHNLQTDQLGLVARSLAWQATGDAHLLEDSGAALVRHMTQNLWMYTGAEPFTDRVWIPTLAAQRERLGGVAYYRNYIYPGHAVSWEDTGGEIAALVLSTRPDALRVEVFNAGARARRVTMRVWQLENGRYEMKAGGDRRTVALKRHSPVAFEAPPGALTVELRQVAKGRPLAELPDLAIAAEEIGGGEVPVHNIGAAASGPFTVTVRDQRGKMVAEWRHAGLEAPLDLKRKVVVARIPELRGGMRVEVRGAGEEICDENNVAVVR